jgi:hypothetical protein
MYKYNMHSVMAEYKHKPLPEDINIFVENSCSKVFSNPKLNAMLKEARIKKLFGKGYYIINNFPVVEFDFHFGMCIRFELMGETGISFKDFMAQIKNPVEMCIFKRSVRNEDIEPRQKKEGIA